MAEKRVLQILFFYKDTARLNVAELEKTFNTYLDWLRFNTTAWLVWTDRSVTDVYRDFVKHITKDDSVVIFRVDLKERHGWANKLVWDWIDKPRPS